MSHKVSLFMTHLQLNMGLVQLVQMIHADVCVRVSRINRAKKKKKNPIPPLLTLSKPLLPFLPLRFLVRFRQGRCESQFTSVTESCLSLHYRVM